MKWMALFFFMWLSLPVKAALPPQYQNARDLDVMVAFVKAHPQVAATLEAINLSDFTVTFGEGCQARFARKQTEKPEGWVGPADPLEFREANCDIE